MDINVDELTEDSLDGMVVSSSAHDDYILRKGSRKSYFDMIHNNSGKIYKNHNTFQSCKAFIRDGSWRVIIYPKKLIKYEVYE